MASVDDFWAGEHYAVIGVHAKGRWMIPMFVDALLRAGKRVTLVDARGGQLRGRVVVSSLEEAPRPIDGALIVTEPEAAEEAVRACAVAGVPKVWLDTRGDSRAAAQAARDSGLMCVEEFCPLIAIPGSGAVHRFHRWLLDNFGRLRRT